MSTYVGECDIVSFRNKGGTGILEHMFECRTTQAVEEYQK
jgi:hypothetical protein